MREEEIAIDRWENEGGRMSKTRTARRYSRHLRATRDDWHVRHSGSEAEGRGQVWPRLVVQIMQKSVLKGRGMAKDPCATCGGTGAIRCNHCGGTAMDQNSGLLNDVCRGCKGTGKERCQDCLGTGEWRPLGIAAADQLGGMIFD